jgi:hypothetical protein
MISVLSLVKGLGGNRSVRGLLVWHVLALSVCFQWPAFAALGEEANAVDGSAKTVTRARKPVGMEGRVELLAKELDLDAAQQVALRRILEDQRNQTAKAWSDASVPAGVRVKTTQMISERTADQIRALLNDEQRKKYIQPLPSEAKLGASNVDVELWMNKGTQK